MAQELDCRGMDCPKPVMAARDLIAAAHPESIAILVDNEAAVENVSRFLGRSGYAANTVANGPGTWRIEATRKGGAAQADAPGDDKRAVVLITAETMGRGDDGLGAKLMQNFLATLPELGSGLWRVILLNGGVKLAAKPGPCLDSLKNMAAEGVEILVCGTCLSHYGLLEQKGVGETTNMLDIVTSLAAADKIVRV